MYQSEIRLYQQIELENLLTSILGHTQEINEGFLADTAVLNCHILSEFEKLGIKPKTLNL